MMMRLFQKFESIIGKHYCFTLLNLLTISLENIYKLCVCFDIIGAPPHVIVP